MRRPDPPPVRTDDVRVVTVGTALWGAAFVVAVLLRSRLRDDGRLWWLGTCAAGFALGLLGLAYTRRRAAAIARDDAAARRSQD
jgi:Flp pilus assembly protein protease CpaA